MKPSWWEAGGRTTVELFAPPRVRVTAAAFELELLRTGPSRPRPPARSGPGGWFLQRRDRLTSSLSRIFCTTTGTLPPVARLRP